jgi:hypothetical protein
MLILKSNTVKNQVMKTIWIGRKKYRLLITRKKEPFEISTVLIQCKKPLKKWETETGTNYMTYTEALKYLGDIRKDYEWEQVNKKLKPEYAEIPKNI